MTSCRVFKSVINCLKRRFSPSTWRRRRSSLMSILAQGVGDLLLGELRFFIEFLLFGMANST